MNQNKQEQKVRKIISSIVQLAYSKGVAGEGFVNTEPYTKELLKLISQARQEAVEEERSYSLEIAKHYILDMPVGAPRTIVNKTMYERILNREIGHAIESLSSKNGEI